MSTKTVDFNIRNQARQKYWQGYPVAEISRQLEVPYATIDSWKRREKWDDAPVALKVESAIDIRLCQLINKTEKTERDFNEIELLTKSLERTARIRRYEAGGTEADLNPKIKKRNQRKQQKTGKNFLPEQAVKELKKAFKSSLFPYQRVWLKARDNNRIRNILKSRQIGATWYFAREAVMDAIANGTNQIFLSASKAQAHVFRQYILQFVKDVTGIELRGDPITLWNGANLYFLGTNSRTAQSYHGNLYIDEYFWIYRFQELRKVASGMAMHKQWKQTYFSTPSTLNHDAYPFWDGQLFNRGRKKAQKVEIDISHQALAAGQTCDDGQWRQIVTVEDAVAAGCDLFDLEQLKLEYNEQEYNNLLMCQFVDDAASIFTLSELQACMVDSWTVWDDFYPLTSKPLSNRPVWIGYDPSRTRDDASCVVVSPPMVSGGKFRVLEKHSWNNLDFDSQANRIKSLTRQYNVQHIAIDTSGIGYGVYELVRKFFPATTKITYSVEVKNRLVLKAKQLISHRRLEFDSGWNDMALAFLTIHKTSTTSGKQVTYQASRTNETGHADLAWALMHALDREPLMSIDESGGGSRTVMEIF